MQSADPRELGLELLEAAFRPGDDRGCLHVLVRAQHLVELLALAGLVHEQAELLMRGLVQRVGKLAAPAHARDDPAAGLLGRLLADALPALELLFRHVGLGNAAPGVEEQDLLRPGLDAFLDDVVGPVALRQPAEHRDLHARLRRAGHDLDHLGFDLLLVRADQAALIVRPLAVADDEVLAGLHAQHMHVLRVPALHDRHAAVQIRPGHEKSRHRPSRPVEKIQYV